MARRRDRLRDRRVPQTSYAAIVGRPTPFYLRLVASRAVVRARVCALGLVFSLASVVILAGIGLLGCNREASRTRDRFLEALKRDDFAAAYGELHPDARATVPNEAALRAQVEASGIRITEWSTACSSGGMSDERLGLNTTSTTRDRDRPRRTAFEIGAPIDWSRSCKGPLLLQLKKDGDAWKVASFGKR